MALDYDGSPNGLFIQLGKIAKAFFAQKTDATDLDSDLSSILTVFNAMNSGEPALMIETFATSVDGWKTQHTTRRATLNALALTRLQDRVTVLDQIGAITTEKAEILRKLIDKMTVDGESVDGSVVTVGSTTPAGTNTGTGTVLTTKVLDGVTSPGAGWAGTYPAHLRYNGVNSQLAVPSETITIECSADSFADGLTEGDETFTIEGRIAGDANGWEPEGSASVGSASPTAGANSTILTNGDFETFTDDVPDGWTLVAGTAGTHLVEESAALDVYHGGKCLRFDGDGTQASIEIKLPIANAIVTANKRYLVSCWIKGTATIAAGAVLISFEGTGYTAGSDKIAIAAGDIPTSYALYHFFVTMPETIPSDFRVVVRWSGTPTAAKKLWIDDLACAPVTYGAGVGMAIVRGSVPFVRGDRFTFTLANDEAGTFQKYFRQAFGVQLPSDVAGAETIADTLAE